MSRVAVYIGAGLDVRPIRAMKDIDMFIYVDSRPATEQPGHDKYYTQCDKSFVSNFNRKMEILDFDWDISDAVLFNIRSKKKDMIEYHNGNKVVRYYMNTSFPDKNEKLLSDIALSDTLIVAGYHPHSCIINMMKKPIDVICWEGTVYDDGDDEDTKNSVIKKLYNNMDDIRSIQYYKKEYVMTQFDNIADLEIYRRN
jgi:hypothetical protein